MNIHTYTNHPYPDTGTPAILRSPISNRFKVITQTAFRLPRQNPQAKTLYSLPNEMFILVPALPVPLVLDHLAEPSIWLTRAKR